MNSNVVRLIHFAIKQTTRRVVIFEGRILAVFSVYAVSAGVSRYAFFKCWS